MSWKGKHGYRLGAMLAALSLLAHPVAAALACSDALNFPSDCAGHCSKPPGFQKSSVKASPDQLPCCQMSSREDSSSEAQAKLPSRIAFGFHDHGAVWNFIPTDIARHLASPGSTETVVASNLQTLLCTFLI